VIIRRKMAYQNAERDLSESTKIREKINMDQRPFERINYE